MMLHVTASQVLHMTTWSRCRLFVTYIPESLTAFVIDL
jgi:hypothetical protein